VGNSGQATIEYILILSMGLLMAIGVSKVSIAAL